MSDDISDPGGYLAVGGIVTGTREECARAIDALAEEYSANMTILHSGQYLAALRDAAKRVRSLNK